MLLIALAPAVASADDALSREGPARVAGLDADLVLALEDGRKVRLALVHVPDPQAARPLVERALGDGAVWLEHGEAALDRYGRLKALVEAGGVSLQAMLLRAGLAVLRYDLLPGVMPEGALAGLRAAERAARGEGLGIWAGGGVLAQEDAASRLGDYAIVRGKVLQATRARHYLYLNFGEDWRDDFSVRLPLKTADALEKAGFDALALEGRTIEVRGWLFAANGPMIEVTQRAQIEEQ